MAATGLKRHDRCSHRRRPALGLAALLLAALLIALVSAPALVPDSAQAAKSKNIVPKTGLWTWQFRADDGRLQTLVEWLVEKNPNNPKMRIVTDLVINTGGVDCDPTLNPVKPESSFGLSLVDEKERIYYYEETNRSSFGASSEWGYLRATFTSKTRAKGDYLLPPNSGLHDNRLPDGPTEGDCVWQSSEIKRRFEARRILPLALNCEEVTECEEKYPAVKGHADLIVEFLETWSW